MKTTKILYETGKIIVLPDDWRYNLLSDKSKRSFLEDIAKEIKRHVDNIGNITVEIETKDVCELCGLDWETYIQSDFDADNTCIINMPACCMKAQDEFLASIGKVSIQS